MICMEKVRHCYLLAATIPALSVSFHHKSSSAGYVSIAKHSHDLVKSFRHNFIEMCIDPV